MAITKPPKPRLVSGAPLPHDRKVADLIRRAPNNSQGEAERVETITVRVPSGVLARVDHSAKHRRIKIPRQAWLLEAILDKLEAEAGK